jgi:hypothetical protein
MKVELRGLEPLTLCLQSTCLGSLDPVDLDCVGTPRLLLWAGIRGCCGQV